jgi:DNA-binding Lrp family transcriptional regulator
MAVTIDDTDRALLALLARDARMPAAELARRIGIARTTVQARIERPGSSGPDRAARIERIETGGVICGHTVKTSVGPGAMIRAYMLIQAEPRRTGAVAAILQTFRKVESLHTTTGRFDLAARIDAPDTARLDEALDRISLAQGGVGMETLVQLSAKIDRRW